MSLGVGESRPFLFSSDSQLLSDLPPLSWSWNYRKVSYSSLRLNNSLLPAKVNLTQHLAGWSI